MGKINLVYTSDDRYAPCLGVSLVSILLNAREVDVLSVYIVDGGISLENREKIAALQKVKAFSLSFLDVNTELFEKCSIRAEYGMATFFRLALPEILSNLEKVIYLDCDVIVRRSLSELWAYDVTNGYLAAAPDLIDYLPFSAKRYKDKLYGRSDFCYFNSGVMVLNLKKIRLENLFQQAIAWLEKHGDISIYCDQDGLNAAVFGDFIKLQPEWNVQAPMYWPGAARVLKKRGETLAALSDPSIIHFTTGDKPWEPYSLCRWRGLFNEFCRQSPWSDSSLFTPVPANVAVTICKHFCRRAWLRILWLGGICLSWKP